MSSVTKLATPVIVVTGIALLSGCQQGSDFFSFGDSPTLDAKSTPTRSSSLVTNADPVDPPVVNSPTTVENGFTETGVTWGGEEPKPLNPSRAALIGLYGEITPQAMYAADQGQGESNISQVSFSTEGGCFNPDVNQDGTKLIFASTQHRPTADIYWKRPGSRPHTQLTRDPANDIMPVFSPDDQHFAFASDRSGNWDIYLMPITGGPAVQLTRDSDDELHPTFSSDGKYLAYCKLGSRSGRWEIWVQDLQNSTTPRFLEYGLFPQWSPDVTSNKILFQQSRQRGSRFHSVWTFDFADGEAWNKTEIVSAENAAIINPSWSPDGRRIVFATEVNPDRQVAGKPAQSDLWVINLDGTELISLTNGQFANFEPVWAADGSIYFVSNRSGLDNIWAKAAGSLPEHYNTTTEAGLVTVTPDQTDTNDAP